MQLFVIRTRNGVLGTEAGFLMYPAIASMFLHLGWRRFEPGRAA
jgi:hypothetical protein